VRRASYLGRQTHHREGEERDSNEQGRKKKNAEQFPLSSRIVEV